MTQNKRFIFKQVPDGIPKPGQDIGVDEVSFDQDCAPPPGGLITKNLYFSFDPYMRRRMHAPGGKSNGGPYTPGEPMWNYGVSKVLKSDSEKVKQGDYVASFISAEQYSTIPAALLDYYDFYVIPKDEKLPKSLYCGALGMPGLTAYASLYEIGAPKKGETIWVSAASGAVGQIVGQLAKNEGMTVIGSVGSDEKVDFVMNKAGFDAAFNYKKEKPRDAIARLAPNGIDIYYDNVGGDHLEAALDVMNDFGRIVACGQISGYNIKPEDSYPIRNTFQMVAKRLKFQGFSVSDQNMGPSYIKDHKKNLGKWLRDGSFRYWEDVAVGLDKAPEAFVGMLKGKNFGKAVVKIADDE